MVDSVSKRKVTKTLKVTNIYLKKTRLSVSSRLCNNNMELQITDQHNGWWVISHEGKLWLPEGELPFGSSTDFQLTGKTGRQIGEWEGSPVWLVRKSMDSHMVSARQLLDQEKGLFQLVGRGVQLAEFYRSHKFCGYCGHEMHVSKTEWAALCGHCRERYTRKLRLASLWLSAKAKRFYWLSMFATVTGSTPCWRVLSRLVRRWKKPSPVR